MVRVGMVKAGAAALAGAFLAISGPAAAAKCPAPDTYADLYQRLKPAVVNISTAQKVRGGGASGELAPLQRKFSRPAVSLGSGFIIDAKGIVVTNNHVIDNADEITVNLSDGREIQATVRGRDRETDLAVLELQSSSARFPFVSFGREDCARVGDKVIAIGNPFGLGGTMTQGIVSARNLRARN